MRFAVALVSLLWAAVPAFASDPTNLVATRRSDTQLDLQWNANGTSFVTVDYLGPQFFGGVQPTCSDFPNHGNIFETGSDPVIIGGLQPFTWYHIHVHAIDPATHQTIGGSTNIIIVRTRTAGSVFEPLAPGSPDYTICNQSQTFTDNPLSPQVTPVKAVHITELRNAINTLRSQASLAAFTFTDPTLTAGTTPVKAVHITELRTALNAVYDALARPRPTYADPTLVAGATVKAVHVSDLRNAVLTVS